MSDLIRRADAIEAVSDSYDFIDAIKAIEELPSAELPKGDLISRADVLKYPIRLDHYDEVNGDRVFVYGVESVIEYAESLPSADAAQGEWEHWGSPFSDESEVIDTIVCSVCGARFIEPKDEPTGEYNYCPNCGARMRGNNVST